jgi:hypothetical protein
MLIEGTGEVVFTRFAVQLGSPFIEHPRQYDVTSQLQSGAPWRALCEIRRIHRIQSESGWKEVNQWLIHLKRFRQVCERCDSEFVEVLATSRRDHITQYHPTDNFLCICLPRVHRRITKCGA